MTQNRQSGFSLVEVAIAAAIFMALVLVISSLAVTGTDAQELGRRISKMTEIAQDVTDALFRHLDVALREIGVGDVSVPKKMKTLAQGYLGRVAAYAGPLEAGDAEALAAAIARNVFGDAGRAQDAQAQRMARYALSWRAELAGLTVERLLAEPLPQRDARAVS